MPNPLVRRGAVAASTGAASPTISLPPVMNIAHRGARAYAPENTVPAFLKAIDIWNVPAVELDVHLSKDGQLVVVHDDDLRRTTPDVVTKFPKPAGTPYFVSDFTLEEIQSLDAGSWFVQQIKMPAAQRQPFLRTLTDDEIAKFIPPKDQELYSSGSVKIPTLEEVFKAVFSRSQTCIVNVELKCLPRMYPGLAEKVVDLVFKHGFSDRVLLSSFDHAQVPLVRKYLQDKHGDSRALPIAALVAERVGRVVKYLEVLEADAYNPGCNGEMDIIGFNSVTGQLDQTGDLRDCIASGFGINVWTENDKSRMAKMIKEKVVTGIFNDYPNRMAEALQEAGLALTSTLVGKGTTISAPL